MKKHMKNKLAVAIDNSKCSFCKSLKNDILNYGPKYQLGKIKAHYYCVLLSNRLIQNGLDNEGILGFLQSDIESELQRTTFILCVYCKKGNATIKCARKHCKKSFHLPCGIKNGTLNEFTDQFKSFCHKHRPFQIVPPKILKEACRNKVICCICLNKVHPKNKINSLWAPCCMKTWYHRKCVQQLAQNAGYFFKCANCNDAEKFSKCMQRFGIFIPQQDASWELVPNAFEELLYRYGTCDAKVCKCPGGRDKNIENTIWEVIVCESCGSQGIHVTCGNLKFRDPEWECSFCNKITEKMKSKSKVSDPEKPVEASSQEGKLSISEICHKKRKRSSEDWENIGKKKRGRFLSEKNETENLDDIEIDVESTEEELKSKDVSEPLDKEVDILSRDIKTKEGNGLKEVLGILKPGPLSYKLSLIEKLYKASQSKVKTEESNMLDVIELSSSNGKCLKPIEKISENYFDLISCENPNAEVEKEELNIRNIENVEIDETSSQLTLSFRLHAEKWEMDEELFILNMSPIKKGFVKNPRTQKSQLNFIITPPKNKNTHYLHSIEEIDFEEDCELIKSKSNSREKEVVRTTSEDNIIFISD